MSLSPGRRDMRVLAFEDRGDCLAAVTLMGRWDMYTSVGAQPTVRAAEALVEPGLGAERELFHA